MVCSSSLVPCGHGSRDEGVSESAVKCKRSRPEERDCWRELRHVDRHDRRSPAFPSSPPAQTPTLSTRRASPSTTSRVRSALYGNWQQVFVQRAERGMDSKGLVADSLFHLIHELHTTVVQAIDTSLSWDQLNSPPINYTLVRPLVERYGNQVAKQTGGAPTASTLLPTRRDNERGHPVAEDVAIRPSSLSGVLFALMANR